MPAETPNPALLDELWKNQRELSFSRIYFVLIGNDEELKKQELQDTIDYCVYDDTNILMMLGGVELACRLCVSASTRKYGHRLIQAFDKYLRDNEITVKVHHDRRSGTMSREFIDTHLPHAVSSIVHHIQNHKQVIPISESSTPALDKVVGIGLSLSRDKTDYTDRVIAFPRRNEAFTDEFVPLESFITKLIAAAQSSSFLSNEPESMIAFYDVLDLLVDESYSPVNVRKVTYHSGMPKIVVKPQTPLADFKKYLDRSFSRQERSSRISLKDVLESSSQDRFNQNAIEFLANAPKGDRLWADIIQSIFLTPVVFDEDITDNSVFTRREMHHKIFGFQQYLAKQVWTLAANPSDVDPKTRNKLEQIIDSQAYINQVFLAKTVLHAATHQQWFNTILNSDEPIEQETVTNLAQGINDRYAAFKSNWPKYRASLVTALNAEAPKSYQVRRFIKAFDFVFEPDQVVDVPLPPATTTAHGQPPSEEPYPDYKTYFTIGRPLGFQGAIGITSSEPTRHYSKTSRANIETLSVQAAKGDAFEQLAGCVLSILQENIDAPLIPQFAINRKYNPDGTVKYASRRIDFATSDGKRVYEIKWGGAKGEIVETLERDKPVVESSEIEAYYLVTFNKKTDRKMGRLPSDKMQEITFEELCDQIQDETLHASLISIGEFIRSLANASKPGDHAHKTLDLLKDALFSVCEETRALPAEAKLQQLKNSLVEISKLVRSYVEGDESFHDWQHKLQGLTNTTFSPLTMHILTKTRSGRPYIFRTKIPPTTLVFEEPKKYRATWQFDQYRFSTKRARDVAIAIELSGRDPSKCISNKDSTNSIITDPIFEIDGEKFTTNEELHAQRPDLKGIYSITAFARKIGLRDDDITFLQQYIQEVGKVAK